jgi:hypothetical protein
MRAVVLCGLVATASADPKPIKVEIPPIATVTQSDRIPAFGGGYVFGNVIDPGPHPDAQPFPRGMVIQPPDTGDHNVIVPGTRGLLEDVQTGIIGVIKLLFPRPT